MGWKKGRVRGPLADPTILERLRGHVTDGGRSRRDCARRVGVSDRQVRRWLSGEDSIHAHHQPALEAWLAAGAGSVTVVRVSRLGRQKRLALQRRGD